MSDETAKSGNAIIQFIEDSMFAAFHIAIGLVLTAMDGILFPRRFAQQVKSGRIYAGDLALPPATFFIAAVGFDIVCQKIAASLRQAEEIAAGPTAIGNAMTSLEIGAILFQMWPYLVVVLVLGLFVMAAGRVSGIVLEVNEALRIALASLGLAGVAAALHEFVLTYGEGSIPETLGSLGILLALVQGYFTLPWLFGRMKQDSAWRALLFAVLVFVISLPILWGVSEIGFIKDAGL